MKWGQNDKDIEGALTSSVHTFPWWLRALGAFVICFCCVRPAYAAQEQVILSDQMAFQANSNEVLSGWLMLAYNPFNAAVLVIGQNPQDYRLDLDVRAKLSNASTGGAFYQLSQAIHDTGASGNDMPSWAAGLYNDFGNLWGGTATANGMHLYWCEVTQDLIRQAKQDYLTILHGGSLGGDDISNIGLNGYNLSYVSSPKSTKGYLGGIDNKKNNTSFLMMNVAPDICTLKLTDNTVDAINLQLGNGRDVIIYINGQWSNQSSTNNVVMYAIPHGSYTYEIVNNGYGVNLPEITIFSNVNYSASSAKYTSGTYLEKLQLTKTTDSTFTSSSSGTNGRTYLLGGNRNSTNNNYGCYSVVLYTDGTTSIPQPSPNNWPSDPEPIEVLPPDVPEPDDDIDIPDFIEKPTYVYHTTTVDLQGVLDALDEHCEHLQDSIYDNISGYYDSMSGYLGQELYGLKTYLKELFEWLADQMDFTFTADGYDDASVVSWLKRIYSKLGGGFNTKPVDPVNDPIGIGDWFAKLFENFIGALFGIGADAVQGLLSELQALKEKFPFCIPWDLAAILALLVANPVAPAFDVPLYTITSSGLTHIADYEIDLRIFDPYMVGIRTMETLLFAFCLAFKTDFFKGILTVRSA